MKKIKETVARFDGHDDLQFVGITVDPEYDTVDNLRAYANRLRLGDPTRWVLLTGDKGEIYRLARETFASQAFQRSPSTSQGRSFVHSEHFYVIDSQRRLRAVLNGTRIDVQEDLAAALAAMK